MCLILLNLHKNRGVSSLMIFLQSFVQRTALKQQLRDGDDDEENTKDKHLSQSHFIVPAGLIYSPLISFFLCLLPTTLDDDLCNKLINLRFKTAV